MEATDNALLTDLTSSAMLQAYFDEGLQETTVGGACARCQRSATTAGRNRAGAGLPCSSTLILPARLAARWAAFRTGGL